MNAPRLIRPRSFSNRAIFFGWSEKLEVTVFSSGAFGFGPVFCFRCAGFLGVAMVLGG